MNQQAPEEDVIMTAQGPARLNKATGNYDLIGDGPQGGTNVRGAPAPGIFPATGAPLPEGNTAGPPPFQGQPQPGIAWPQPPPVDQGTPQLVPMEIAQGARPPIDRFEFELRAAIAFASGLRNPKDFQKIAIRAQQLADHYDERGYFDPQAVEVLRVDEDAHAQQQPGHNAPMFTSRVVGKDGPPGARAQGRPVINVAGDPNWRPDNPRPNFAGKVAVDCTHGGYKRGNGPPAGQKPSTMRQPAPSPYPQTPQRPPAQARRR